jgi:two-component system sensor histidine kinase BaeS
MARRRWHLLGPLGWRLFAAFTVVGLGAVGLLAVLAARSVQVQTSGLVDSQRAQVRNEIVAALVIAYTRAGSWQDADLAPVYALTDSTGARLVILDTTGGQVATVMPHGTVPMPMSTGSVTSTAVQGGPPTAAPPHPAPMTTASHAPAPASSHHGQPMTTSSQAHPNSSATTARPSGHMSMASPAGTGGHHLVDLASAPSAAAPQPGSASTAAGVPIVVAGRTVGTVVIDLPARSSSPTYQARDAIMRSVAIGALAAVLLAVAAALFASRRTTRPLTALAEAAGAVERGEPNPSSLLRPGPGELGQVSRAFARMANSLRREDDLRRALVADVAHELRTPVTILRGGTEQLLDGLAAPTPDKLSSLHDEVLRLERLVDDLAALAAAESSGLSLHRTPVDVGAVAADAANALKSQFEDAQLDTLLEIEPVTVNGDSTRLNQIVTNLLTNAIKFTPPHGCVTVSTRHADGAAVLTVTDTGPGIPEDELPRVFDRFWRGSAARTRDGSGIGLAVVAELVAAHAGTVIAANAAGAGAVFTVTLPAS